MNYPYTGKGGRGCPQHRDGLSQERIEKESIWETD